MKTISEQHRRIILKVLKVIEGPILDQEMFLCCAASAAEKKGLIFKYECDIFIEFVRKRIKGHYTVISWLQSNGFNTKSATTGEIHNYRKRWVAALIKEFS